MDLHHPDLLKRTTGVETFISVSSAARLVKQGSVYSIDVLKVVGESVIFTPPPCERLGVSLEQRQESAHEKQSHQMVVAQLTASQPGTIDQHFTIHLPGREVEVLVTAKIMPTGKGTPALRSEVRSLGRMETEETDFE